MLTPRERDVQAGIGIEFLGGAAEQFSALESYIDERIDAGVGEDAERPCVPNTRASEIRA